MLELATTSNLYRNIRDDAEILARNYLLLALFWLHIVSNIKFFGFCNPAENFLQRSNQGIWLGILSDPVGQSTKLYLNTEAPGKCDEFPLLPGIIGNIRIIIGNIRIFIRVWIEYSNACEQTKNSIINNSISVTLLRKCGFSVAQCR